MSWFDPTCEEPSRPELTQGQLSIARVPMRGDNRRPDDIVDRRGEPVGTLMLALGEELVGPRYASQRHGNVEVGVQEVVALEQQRDPA